MQSYSQDLRDRVLRALSRGEGPSAIARRFEVSRFYVYQVRDREQETGFRNSFPIRRPSPVSVGGSGVRFARLDRRCAGTDSNQVARAVDITGCGRQNRPSLASVEQVESDRSKKTLHASEQEREDVQAARRAWSEAQQAMDVEKLVFIDETWAATNVRRELLWARSQGLPMPRVRRLWAVGERRPLSLACATIE